MASSYLNGQVVDSIRRRVSARLSTTPQYGSEGGASGGEEAQPLHDFGICKALHGRGHRRIPQGRISGLPTIRAIPYILKAIQAIKILRLPFTAWKQRDRSHSVVTYESEVLETIQPASEKHHTADYLQPIGFVDVQSAHVGYKARLWKVVTENGVEVSREQINSKQLQDGSPYGNGGGCHERHKRYNEMQAAIATGSIDQVKSVAAALKNSQSSAPAGKSRCGSCARCHFGRKVA